MGSLFLVIFRHIMEKINLKRSSADGSIKILWASGDKQFESAAFYAGSNKYSVCISTQSNCNMGCRTCALSYFKDKEVSNLSPEELDLQISGMQSELENAVINWVGYMGMGEPLMNYDNVINHMAYSHHLNGLNHQEVAVSTVGLPDKIRDLAQEKFRFGSPTLQLSVHKIHNRGDIIPIDKMFSLQQSISAAEEYSNITGEKVRANYILLKDINDSKTELDSLSRLFNPSFFDIWLADYSPNKFTDYKGVSKKEKSNMASTIRECSAKYYETPIDVINFELLGRDIEAGCGQLKGKCL